MKIVSREWEEHKYQKQAGIVLVKIKGAPIWPWFWINLALHYFEKYRQKPDPKAKLYLNISQT